MGQRRRKSSFGKFTALHEALQESLAWRALSPAERAVYVELARRYNGLNNGSLFLSVREAGELCNVSKSTAGRALRVLEERGLIQLVTPSGFSRKDRVAAEWRLTFYRCDRTKSAAARTFSRWKPEAASKQQSQRAASPSHVGDSGTESTPSQSRLRDSSACGKENPVPAEGHYLDCAMPPPARDARSPEAVAPRRRAA